MEVVSLPFDTLFEGEDPGDYQTAVASWIADYNDPMTFLDLWTPDASFNKVDFSNDRYDRLIADAKAEPNAARRVEMMEAERIVVEESAALAPIYFFASASLTKPYARKYVVHPYGPASNYKRTSIEG